MTEFKKILETAGKKLIAGMVSRCAVAYKHTHLTLININEPTTKDQQTPKTKKTIKNKKQGGWGGGPVSEGKEGAGHLVLQGGGGLIRMDTACIL